MKTIYLHIGRGKTGTTAQQRFLSGRREDLLRCGVDYLRSGDMGRGHGHQAFAKSFITSLPGYMIPAAHPQAIRDATAAEICASTAPAVLQSSENFPLADIPALARWFAALAINVQIKVIFFVRSQDEVAESEYNQMVKLKSETRSFADYAEALEGVDYAAECAKWAAGFGSESILARVHDAAAQDGIAQLLACLSPQAAALAGERRDETAANRSLGARALLTARLFNGGEIEGREALYHQVFAALAPHDIPAVLFDAAGARAFRARFADSNARFSKTYLGTPQADLGGRRYDDATRDRLHAAVRALGHAL